MAKAELILPDEAMRKLAELPARLEAETIEKALKEAGKIAEKAYRNELSNAIGKNLKFQSRSTGELIRSLGTTDVRYSDKTDTYNIKVGFKEPRKSGKKNSMIANIIEHGTRTVVAKHPLRKAQQKARKNINGIVHETIEKEVAKFNDNK